MNPIRRRESVCRSLFGPVDHDQLRRDLKQRLKEITEQDSRRWNFNFQSDTPLPGRFQWEEIPADCTAVLYQESAQLKDSVCEDDDRLSDREESAGTDQENCSSISNTHKCPAEVTPVRRKRTHSKSAPKPRSNARITGEQQKSLQIHNRFHTYSTVMTKWWSELTSSFLSDFFAKRRRTTETKSAMNPFHTSSSEAAQCKTIRWTLCWKWTIYIFICIFMYWTKAYSLHQRILCYFVLMLFYFLWTVVKIHHFVLFILFIIFLI